MCTNIARSTCPHDQQLGRGQLLLRRLEITLNVGGLQAIRARGEDQTLRGAFIGEIENVQRRKRGRWFDQVIDQTGVEKHALNPLGAVVGVCEKSTDPFGHEPEYTSLLCGRGVAAILNHMVQYSPELDSSFAAIADPTRRGILERLGRGNASITDLADLFEMTLTGMKKHVQVLEDARLVTTEKIGRVRTCRLGPRRLDRETAWIASYQKMLEERFDRLEQFLERNKGEL
jgi:DNA-binding transcriptional ArsR family regulator